MKDPKEDPPTLLHLLLSHQKKQCDLCGVALLMSVIQMVLMLGYWWHS